jgi:hypothetical protein
MSGARLLVELDALTGATMARDEVEGTRLLDYIDARLARYKPDASWWHLRPGAPSPRWLSRHIGRGGVFAGALSGVATPPQATPGLIVDGCEIPGYLHERFAPVFADHSRLPTCTLLTLGGHLQIVKCLGFGYAKIALLTRIAAHPRPMLLLFEHGHPEAPEALAAMHTSRRQTVYWSRAGLDAIEGHHELAAFTLSARALCRYTVQGMLYLFWFDQAVAWERLAEDLGAEIVRLHARHGPVDLLVALGEGMKAVPYWLARLKLPVDTRLEYAWKQGRTP